MFLESFRHLIEIEALKKENSRNYQQIASENKRISDLEERRKATEATILNLKNTVQNLKLQEAQNQIEDLQIKLTKLTSQLALSATEKEQAAFENQIQLIKNEVETKEENYFEKLEQSEEFLSQIKDYTEFIHGSLKTLNEIKAEVQDNIAREVALIANRDKRIHSLVELCQPDFKKMYLDLEKKFKPKSPVSYLLDKKCSACFMQMDSVLRSSLEEGRSLEICPNCSRLLIPETAKIY